MMPCTAVAVWRKSGPPGPPASSLSGGRGRSLASRGHRGTLAFLCEFAAAAEAAERGRGGGVRNMACVAVFVCVWPTVFDSQPVSLYDHFPASLVSRWVSSVAERHPPMARPGNPLKCCIAFRADRRTARWLGGGAFQQQHLSQGAGTV
ncbi:hypothetical protein PLESTB_000590100 [Pleodorina starrii]|uniref:Uncharacterized protein n=1 Tax=Pleodorina starrii TaxID=330485 RepID=A0A9W6BI28_9CHLO|nr:hypothetical protein PLESTM_000763300 [Pleodorina starrii]GLC52165.1 hypothetical protein PLESTB_000590100 [Pleodorina starrii]GLC75792.1 hypothetical protein PLESTF_001687900 [Pleodorina starrii]